MCGLKQFFCNKIMEKYCIIKCKIVYVSYEWLLHNLYLEVETVRCIQVFLVLSVVQNDGIASEW